MIDGLRPTRRDAALALTALLAAGASLVSRAAGAQTAPPRPARVGYITAGIGPSGSRFTGAEQIFFDRLRELGWVEGDNLVI